ncbi:HDIG domain-containing protein [Candidatus Bipolaricaulota bacterium]|nr:HDIG domain-containing protein [Candidatus Bipolaricaulota bacterium]MCF7890899.1 HDIG domain-containing protein [Candidatus Bipolaricaulota bacterium]
MKKKLKSSDSKGDITGIFKALTGPSTKGGSSKKGLLLSGYILLISFLFTFNFQSSEPFLVFLPWKEAVSHGLIVAISAVATISYLSLRQEKLTRDNRLMAFLIGTTFILLLTIKGSALVSLYLVPVAFATALTALFLDFETGLSLNLFLAVAVGVQSGISGSIGPVIIAFVGGLVGILEARDINRMSDLTSIGMSVGLVNAVLVFAFRFPTLSSPFIVNLDWPNYLWAVLNGLASALFIAAAVPTAERITQITSPIGLMELLNPSHPLMERLRSETPGTYHHSQNIASLGESAARAIGADPLLTKVGGYYHDIGKMVRPDFFIENQSSNPNPHDDLTPSMSKIVLTSHIKQGINLGKRYGLREDVLSFIPSHHGTSLIKYFYLKALREGRKEVDFPESDFRYEGELPRRKETTIIALADPVEAASHTLEDVGQELEDMVEEQVDSKINDGQLDHSPLTLDDIAAIKEAFISTLRAMDQRRVEKYPEEEPEELGVGDLGKR